MAANQELEAKMHRLIIEEVINGLQEDFLDNGIDEAVLLELKQDWENNLQNKLEQSKQNTTAESTTNAVSQPTVASQAKQTATTPSSAAATATGGAATVVATTPAVRMVPVQIMVPPQPEASDHTAAKSITVHIPAHALQGGMAEAQLQTILSSPAVTAALSLPVEMATTFLQQHINNALQTTAGRSQSRADNGGVTQLDGPGDHDDEELDGDNVENADEESLNSEDGVADDDPSVLFGTDNFVVCQSYKIAKIRNKWKLHLKNGIMNIDGREYFFQNANGDLQESMNN